VRRVAIEYADQNDAFARFLPRSGGVVSELSDQSGGVGNVQWIGRRLTAQSLGRRRGVYGRALRARR
jgi:hypothetical protein